MSISDDQGNVLNMPESLSPRASLKVLYLLHDSRRSGVPAVLSNLVCSLDREVVMPTVWFAHDGVYADELRNAGIDVHTLGPRTPVIWRFKRFLLNFRLMRYAHDFDMIHISSIKLATSVIVAKWLGARVLFHLHERPGRIGRLLVKAFAMADCAVFCARNCQEHFSGVPAKQKRLILNAIRLPDLTTAKSPGLKKKIVMLGSINANKGQDLLLQAFNRLKRDDAELYFYGTVGLSARGYVKRLEDFVREQGLEGRVFFPGPTNRADLVYREATLLVHASLQECLSISVMEALSHGVPVIANDIIGMNEIVNDGVNGYLVPPGDIDALAERMTRLLDDPALCHRMGEAGRDTVRTKFNISTRIQEYIELYEELTAENEPGGAV